MGRTASCATASCATASCATANGATANCATAKCATQSLGSSAHELSKVQRGMYRPEPKYVSAMPRHVQNQRGERNVTGQSE
jgi:hypothetical protein